MPPYSNNIIIKCGNKARNKKKTLFSLFLSIHLPYSVYDPILNYYDLYPFSNHVDCLDIFVRCHGTRKCIMVDQELLTQCNEASPCYPLWHNDLCHQSVPYVVLLKCGWKKKFNYFPLLPFHPLYDPNLTCWMKLLLTDYIQLHSSTRFLFFSVKI